jgi:hypothetical protein
MIVGDVDRFRACDDRGQQQGEGQKQFQETAHKPSLFALQYQRL